MNWSHKRIAATGTLAGSLASLLLLCGCVHLPSGCTRGGREPMPGPILQQFARSPQETVGIVEAGEKVQSNCRSLLVELKVATPLQKTNFTVVCEYFQNSNPHSPVILLLPMAGGSYPVERYMARYYVRHGFAVVLLHRRKFKFDLSEFDAWIIASLQDGQRALDWIGTRPELDATRIGLFGISLGGMKGTLLAAVDPRVRAAILGLAASDLPYVLTHSSESKIARQRERLVREKQLPPEQVEERLRDFIHWDPGQMGAYLDCRQTMLLLAAFDRVVPFKKGWELRARIGQPETLLLFTGHYTAALGMPCIQPASLRFFRQKLAIPPGPSVRLRTPKDTGP
jgi:pimeloyl-ACP methyl ester carboxylesterase